MLYCFYLVGIGFVFDLICLVLMFWFALLVDCGLDSCVLCCCFCLCLLLVHLFVFWLLF